MGLYGIIMSTSRLCEELFGNKVKFYSSLLIREKNRFLSKYCDNEIEEEITPLDKRIISIMPMALCDSLLRDIGISASEELLTGLGLLVFHISTHDDIVDEDSKSKRSRAGLLYSGDMLLIEGINLLIKSGNSEVLPEILEVVEENHFRQKLIASILWKKEKPTVEEYNEGIKHIVSFTKIGLMAALTFANRLDLSFIIDNYSENYGLSLQYLDDMSEIDEDIKNGYWSLPIIRASEKWRVNFLGKEEKNKLIAELKMKAYERICTAKSSIPKEWSTMHNNLDRMLFVIRNFKYG